MTTDGNFNTKNVNTVNIPTVIKSISQPGIGSGSDTVGPQYYFDSKYFYTVDGLNNTVYKAPINDIFNGVGYPNLQPAGQGNYFASIYPNALPDDYYYNYSAVNDLGTDAGGKIYRASKSNPLAWYDTGTLTATSATRPMVYYNGTDVYLIGGTVASTPIDTVDVGTGITFTLSGNTLPAPRANGALVTVDSNIYMYGGTENGTDSVGTIWTATTAAPDVWTDTGISIPGGVLLQGAIAFCDGVNVYLYGGYNSATLSDSNAIFVAPIANPTSLVASGNTLPVGASYLNLYSDASYIYLLLNGGGMYRASTSTPTVFTTMSNNLATSVRSSHVGIHNNVIYSFGGFTTGTTAVNTIQSATVSNPTTWTNSGTTLPANLAGGELIKTNTSFYIIGCNGTTGNYYSSLLSDPETFTLAGSSGPTRIRGRAAIIQDDVWYFGGETAVTTPVATVNRAVIDRNTGEIHGWKSTDTGHLMNLPIALSRFSLVVSGDYVYILGGYTTGPLMNYNIYRCHINLLSSSTGSTRWQSVGVLSNPMVDASVVVINNFVYIISGGPNTSYNTSDDYVTYASMTDLANGIVNFTEENSGSQSFSESKAICVNDNIYFIGLRVTSNSTNTIYRSLYSSAHTLIAPRVPEVHHSLPTVDYKSGGLGSYTSFQRAGMLPWLIID